VPPYEKLAEIYDYVMRHVDYQKWASHVQRLLQRCHCYPARILDVACGTGSLLLELTHRGFQVMGFDYSLPMIRMARRKLPGVPLWQGDMRAFAVSRPLEAILCLYDSINYLMTLREVTQMLHCCYRNLVGGGILIFDTCTELNSLRHFTNYRDHGSTSDFEFARWSHYDPQQRIQYTEFKIHFRGSKEIFHEVHQQRVYANEQIREVIRATSFRLRWALDGFTLAPASDRSYRIHWVLMK